MIKCLEKLSFFGCWKSLSAASKCRKTRPCDHRISKFSGGACPRTPLGAKALRALPILCPGVKLSCPPVENLNEPPGWWIPITEGQAPNGFSILSASLSEQWVLSPAENLRLFGFVFFCTHCFYFPYSVTYPRGYRTKFNKGRIHPEVWPLILLNTIFDIVINISNMRCSVSSPDENTTRSGVFLNELRGVSSCDETLRLILDITSQTEWFKKEHFFHLISNHLLNINFLCILLTNC